MSFVICTNVLVAVLPELEVKFAIFPVVNASASPMSSAVPVVITVGCKSIPFVVVASVSISSAKLVLPFESINNPFPFASCVRAKAVTPTEAVSLLLTASNVRVAVLAELDVKLARVPVVKLFPVADSPVPVAPPYVNPIPVEAPPFCVRLKSVDPVFAVELLLIV